jgi:predicted alpha/beta hydrolase family esterase
MSLMMRYHFKSIFLVLILLQILSACSGHSTRQRIADSIADQNGFQTQIIKGGKFWLRTYQKITNPSLPYTVYIEGDGFAFKDKYTISDDPTPKTPTVLRLAMLDYRSNVVYLARPCQYLDEAALEHCDNTYWTRKRLSVEIIDSMNDAIKQITHGEPIDLVGYSSGGGAAVLIAHRNKKVRSIITIAGLLDHKLFTTHHRVLPMIGSLNPIEIAHDIRSIPQLHLSGGKDNIIRPSIADKFVKEANSPLVQQEVIPHISHDSGWIEIWPEMLKRPVGK